MVLVDTSVWIDHLRTGSDGLTHRLERGEVLGHPWVIGELALGHLRRRSEILGLLSSLPQATGATEAEVLDLIERRELWGTGIGYVDAGLLAACMLTGATLWTNDRRLAAAASRLGNAFDAGSIERAPPEGSA
jgi:predicted nucleic acid-binding protein